MQDSLLANIAKTEKQTEMAARVSSWKQRIEQNLDDQVNPALGCGSVYCSFFMEKG